MLIAPGPDLDRQIEQKLNGDAKKRTPPYSTSEKAASRLIRRLDLQDMPCSIEEIDGVWFCTLWIVVGSSRERLSTGSGETRALAIARAVLNARLGMDGGVPIARDEVSTRMMRPHASPRRSESASTACARCGATLPARQSDASKRLCSVCSWRAARFGDGQPKAPVEIPISRDDETEKRPPGHSRLAGS